MSGLTNILTAFREMAEDDPTQPPHARAFSYWIKGEAPDAASVLNVLAVEATEVSSPDRRTYHVAVLGYASHMDDCYREKFLDALEWLANRTYFVAGRPRTFEADGLALLGVAVGIRALPADLSVRSTSWLGELLRKSLGDAEANIDWNGSLISGAAAVLGLGTNSKPVLDLLVALEAKGVIDATPEEREAGWRQAFDVSGTDDGMARASTRIAAINALSRDSPAIRFDKVSVSDVGRVLHGLERSLRHWTYESKPRTPRSRTARWEVENEYHVQNLLWALLAPIFPDLDDEEWLKSFGHHHPRADLAIPSLNTIVEAKFLRGGSGQFSKVIEEIAADATTYLGRNSGYSYLIAVVWDDFARTEEHAELRKGLMALRGVTDAIILSRPSFMQRSPGEAPDVADADEIIS